MAPLLVPPPVVFTRTLGMTIARCPSPDRSAPDGGRVLGTVMHSRDGWQVSTYDWDGRIHLAYVVDERTADDLLWSMTCALAEMGGSQ